MSRTPHQKITRLDAADEPVYRDPTRKRIDPVFVPPSCAEQTAVRRAEQHLADVQRAPDPVADLRYESAKPRCAVCGVELLGTRRGHIVCEQHHKAFTGGDNALRGRHIHPSAFDMDAYLWNGPR